MKTTARILTLLILLLAISSQGTAQEVGTEDDDVLERAIAVNEAQGPAATLSFLDSERAKGDLSPPASALLGALLLASGRGAEAYEVLEPITQSSQAPPAVLFNTWQAAALSGRGEERIDLLERAAEADPISPAARQLGLKRGAQGRYQEAFVLLAPWARSQPQDVEGRLAAAAAALQLQRVPEAEEMLGDLPQSIPQVRLLWGKALFLSGDPHACLATLKAFGDGEGLEPGLDRDRRQTMANAYIITGQAAEAVALLDGRQGDDPGLILVLARAQAQSGDVANSLETVRPLAEAVLQNPDAYSSDLAGGALLEFGRQMIATGSAAEAVEPLQLASQIQPYTDTIWQFLGQALAVAGRREEARAALERFNELAQSAVPTSAQQSSLEKGVADPTGRQLREALVLLGQGRAGEALQIVQGERNLAPNDPRVPVIAAQILQALGRVEEALEATEAALQIAPEFADAYYQRGVILMSEQRLDEAEDAFRRALEIAPAHVPTMNDLAVLLTFQSRQDEARQLLERVLELNPDDELAAGNLAALDGS